MIKTVRIFEIRDEDGDSRDFIAAHDADSALEYFAVDFHSYDSVRTCRLDALISEAGARPLSDDELDELERHPDVDDPD